MIFVTHVLFALFVCLFFKIPLDFGIILGSTLPDIDFPGSYVSELRNYLKSKYGTKYCYTHGGSGYESKKEGNTYCLYQGDPDKPRDINGFCFRKDLCNNPPLNRKNILLEVHNFSLEYDNIESVLDESLRIKVENEEYLVHTYIGEGYADEINVVFMKIPNYEY